MQMEPPNLIIVVILAVGSAPPGKILHEVSHYFVGWISGSEPRFLKAGLLGYEIWPVGVDFDRIETMHSRWIRITGSVPIFWLFVSIGIFILISANPEDAVGIQIEILFLSVTIPFAAAVVMSESDVDAMTNPEQFRETTLGEGYSFSWGWPLLIRRTIRYLRQDIPGI